jgi:poly(3-hydroxybutyrate) depolymerase
MKKIYIILLTILTGTSYSQAQCAGGRYASDVFTSFSKTSDITYGQNISAANQNTVLKLDFYEPSNDTETARPLIIMAHGGSFITGTKMDYDMEFMCKAFAVKGYACASIDYRLGFPLDSLRAIDAVARAVQDMKAAVRFFNKDSRDGTNTYKIDTNKIFVGGSSAGAITALHVAYLDKTCELNYYLSPTAVAAVGGPEGNSGHPCYSSKVAGVINLCGGLARYGWLEAGDVPIVSLHGTADGVVKYNRGRVNPGIPLIYLDGSRMVHEQALAVGISSDFYTFLGADHVPYNSNTTEGLAYMDTTMNFVTDFLVKTIGCTETTLQAANTPAEIATLYPFTSCTGNVQTDFCATLAASEVEKNTILNVYPNPTDEILNVNFTSEGKHTVQIIDLTGRIVSTQTSTEMSLKINKGAIKSGSYILKVTDYEGNISTQHVVFQ